MKEPEEYLPPLEKLRERNTYVKSWKLRIEKHTNRHRETGGGYWGWYEVHPLGIEVGFWGSDRDDLHGVDIGDWNQRAAALSAEGQLEL